MLFRKRKPSQPVPKTWNTPQGQYWLHYMDMLNQPHLLIAGATGSGKSVVINALMYTALYSAPVDAPGGKEFILIDPKRVELSQYRSLPHVLRYTSEPQQFVPALNYAMQLCDSRYQRMQAAGQRKYSGSDVYIIIDEFADLMCTNKREIQPLIQRIAQVGRAARIHLIIATQCPLKSIITTEIKCNIDARVALRTRSAQDSRNIIGRNGCECFPRYGKAYYMTPDGEGIRDIQMYADGEIDSRINWWIQQTI